MENLIKQIQCQVVFLLRKRGKKSLHKLSKYLCSEMSRLIGFWFFNKFSFKKIYVLKGANIKNKKNVFHDILALDEGGKVYLIDTTVWQFFKNKKSILVGITKNINEAIKLLEEIYQGKWKISEKINKNTIKEKDVWKKVLKLSDEDMICPF